MIAQLWVLLHMQRAFGETQGAVGLKKGVSGYGFFPVHRLGIAEDLPTEAIGSLVLDYGHRVSTIKNQVHALLTQVLRKRDDVRVSVARNLNVLSPFDQVDSNEVEMDMVPPIGQDWPFAKVGDGKGLGIASLNLPGDPLLQGGGRVIWPFHDKFPPFLNCGVVGLVAHDAAALIEPVYILSRILHFEEEARKLEKRCFQFLLSQ